MALDFHGRLRLIRLIPKPLPPEKRPDYSIENVHTGGLLNIEGKAHYVEAESEYKQGRTPYREFNLVDLDTGKKKFLEFGQDDELVINYWHTTNIPLSKLKFENDYFRDDHGIPDVRDIKLFLDLCNKYDDGEVLYDKQKFYFYESLQATWTGKGKKESQKGFNKHRYWDFLPFESEEDTVDFGVPIVSVERWFSENSDDEDEFDVNYGYRIQPEKISVLAVGKEEKE
jgi:hypothetical protein